MFALLPAVLICDQVINLAENQQQKEVITVNFERERERKKKQFLKKPKKLHLLQPSRDHANMVMTSKFGHRKQTSDVEAVMI